MGSYCPFRRNACREDCTFADDRGACKVLAAAEKILVSTAIPDTRCRPPGEGSAVTVPPKRPHGRPRKEKPDVNEDDAT